MSASWIDDLFLEDERATRGTVVEKHAGPGPHPSGSPQSAHGRSGAIRVYRGIHGDTPEIVAQRIAEVKAGRLSRGADGGEAIYATAVSGTASTYAGMGDYGKVMTGWLKPGAKVLTQEIYWREVPNKFGAPHPGEYARSQGYDAFYRGGNLTIVNPDAVEWDGEQDPGDMLEGLDLVDRPLEDLIEKHKGPGLHPNGSPQAVHAGGGATTSLATFTEEAEDATWTLLDAYQEHLDLDLTGATLKDEQATAMADDLVAVLADSEKQALVEGTAYVDYQWETWQEHVAHRWARQAYSGGDSELLRRLKIDKWDGRSVVGDIDRLPHEDQVWLAAYAHADLHQAFWMTSALDSDPNARRQQELAKETFGGDYAAYDRHLAEMGLSSLDDNEPWGGLQRKIYSTTLATERRRTQEMLDRVLPGVEKIRVYRGMQFPWTDKSLHTGPHPISANPLSSWSIDIEEAANFARDHDTTTKGWVLTAEVPKSMIVASALTGRGSLSEREVILNIPDGYEVYWESEAE